jgi:hypothetical protein
MKANHLTKAILALILGMFMSIASAGEIGTIVNLVGKVTLIKADGSSVPAKIKGQVDEGDTIVTEKGAFAMFKYIDGGEMILKPDTQVKIKEYKFVDTDPFADKSEINVVKGGLRRLTGLIGKRGDKDADKLVTSTATAGIRGTIYDVVVCKGDCDKLADGTYFKVKEGEIVMKNDAGEVSLKAGQYAHVKSSDSLPVVLPKDPGLPTMNPPKTMQNSPNAGCEV